VGARIRVKNFQFPFKGGIVVQWLLRLSGGSHSRKKFSISLYNIWMFMDCYAEGVVCVTGFS